jgi:DNA replication protein
MSFTGFSTDDPIKLPRELFTEILPAISQPAELKVTLQFFYLLRSSRRRPRMVEWADFRGDGALTASRIASSSQIAG